MSEKEKQLIEKIDALPEAMQERFLAMVVGAALAMDAMKEPSTAQ